MRVTSCLGGGRGNCGTMLCRYLLSLPPFRVGNRLSNRADCPFIHSPTHLSIHTAPTVSLAPLSSSTPLARSSFLLLAQSITCGRLSFLLVVYSRKCPTAYLHTQLFFTQSCGQKSSNSGAIFPGHSRGSFGRQLNNPLLSPRQNGAFTQAKVTLFVMSLTGNLVLKVLGEKIQRSIPPEDDGDWLYWKIHADTVSEAISFDSVLARPRFGNLGGVSETLWNVSSVAISFWHHSPPLFSVLPSSAASLSLNLTSRGSSTYSYTYVLSLAQMSPKRVSLQVGLMKRNHLHNRYQVPFAGLLTSILSPFLLPRLSIGRC
ncbi:unnamed protein product [Protopolystoma xenopodis]|uniref:Uncharacterized protein n=1 Tax=Protopolystoma xenopodis TaxID=117903 RepID=A0A3S5A682_9PLAT|nr:unnamed protein product [Protopolystoma xenopodis]